jgi:chromatin modification-related protein YNG2
MSELDAEGEADTGDNAEGEAEDTLYCFCQRQSFGEMIGCDSDDCHYEWVGSAGNDYLQSS